MFLVGNFVAIPAFAQQYGVFYDGEWVIEASWQSALFCAGQVGALIGVFLAGPLTSRLGYRWATLIALVAMNAVIFISYFSNSLPVLFVGQLIAGLPWGM
jgi:MFS transporter, SP family, general alpha glucoside:H+ symporter